MKRVNIHKIYKILEKQVKKWNVPVAELIEIQTKDPFKVLVATILSARTKDQTTAAVCDRLFKKIKKPSDFNKFSEKQIQKLIYPAGFYKTKAKHLKLLPESLKQFNNTIPKTIEELNQLPGVGRKTANLVLGVCFRIPAVCIDVHCHRILNRLGYVATKSPYETEMALRKKLPKKYWIPLNTMLVAFGQNLCNPVSPWCSKCPIFSFCNRINVVKGR
ncbi:MAG: endonuclease III [Candidatus Woesearchaeota archaeon]|jgi:endonuclease III|nr:endonuclease III [Candidatus Woesearchaeota archaeon]|tara:strand:+ start:306 stop:959 length:654 start_codon:yes stop_codon:yes gene_type:complete